ncbi:hypothetical protein SprV_0401551400 [Sparganum proliferum]
MVIHLVEDFREAHEVIVEMCLHLLALHLWLAVGEDQVGGFAVASESTLTFRQKSLYEMMVETTEKKASEDLPGNVEQRNSSTVITHLPIPFTDVEMDDNRVIEILRNVALPPHHPSNSFDCRGTALLTPQQGKGAVEPMRTKRPSLSRRLDQQRLREMQDAWMVRKAEDFQGCVNRNELKDYFSAIKAIYGPPTKGTAAFLSSDGSALLTEKSQILKRWTEHFRSVLKCPSAISDAVIDPLRQVEINVGLDLPPPPPETIHTD